MNNTKNTKKVLNAITNQQEALTQVKLQAYKRGFKGCLLFVVIPLITLHAIIINILIK